MSVVVALPIFPDVLQHQDIGTVLLGKLSGFRLSSTLAILQRLQDEITQALQAAMKDPWQEIDKLKLRDAYTKVRTASILYMILLFIINCFIQ